MSYITVNRLLNIGFIKHDVSPEESGEPEGYFYFSFGEDNETLLISNASDECVTDGCYVVEFFEYISLGKITDYNILKKLVKVLKLIKNGEKETNKNN